MTPQLPEFHQNSILENISVTYFRNQLPPSYIVHKLYPDFGRDLIVEIVIDGLATGKDIVFQLKSSKNSSGNPEYEIVRLKVSTYNYLMAAVSVVMIVKYIQQEDEAYWVYLRDCRPPRNTEQKYFNLHIPRSNRLSEIDWENEFGRISKIYAEKLRAAKGF